MNSTKRQERRKEKSLVNYSIIILNIILLFIFINFLPYEPKVNKGLALLIFVAILWLTEAIHVTTTAIFVPVLAIGLGLSDTRQALSSFADPTIFLFLGGFALAGALHIQKIDIIIANRIVHLAKGRLSHAIFYLFAATALLSMWISNTATVAMMLPLVMGVLNKLDRSSNQNTYTFVLLGIAYSASIGGLGTVVGSPPNAIVASQLNLTFAQWLAIGMPTVLILLPSMIGIIYLIFRPNLKASIDTKLENIKMDTERWITLGIFAFIALCWIFSSTINPIFASLVGFEGTISNFDSFISLFALILICTTQISRWKELQHNVDWGVLLLFGGGLTLSAILKDSGASYVLADLLTAFIKDSSFFVICLSVSLFIIILTEFTSNTACAALLVPIFISISHELGLDPLVLSLIVGIGASCAFMLPVATPPNAMVYGTGKINQKDMIKAGFALNVVFTVVIATLVYFAYESGYFDLILSIL